MAGDLELSAVDPVLLSGCTCRVQQDWIDYNGHMNVAYYVVAFDKATDVFLDRIDMGAAYLETRNGSTFTADMNVSYIAEVGLDAPLTFTTQLIGFDDKRIHYFHHMYHADKGFLVATNECLSLHVDMSVRKVTSIPASHKKILEGIKAEQAHLPPPTRLGRVMRTK